MVWGGVPSPGPALTAGTGRNAHHGFIAITQKEQQQDVLLRELAVYVGGTSESVRTFLDRVGARPHLDWASRECVDAATARRAIADYRETQKRHAAEVARYDAYCKRWDIERQRNWDETFLLAAERELQKQLARPFAPGSKRQGLGVGHVYRRGAVVARGAGDGTGCSDRYGRGVPPQARRTAVDVRGMEAERGTAMMETATLGKNDPERVYRQRYLRVKRAFPAIRRWGIRETRQGLEVNPFEWDEQQRAVDRRRRERELRLQTLQREIREGR